MSNELVSALSLMPETKREQDIFVDKLVESVKQGVISPLKAEAIICNLEQVSKAYRANHEVKDMLLQAVQFKGGKCEDFNAKFQVSEAGVVYDYENSKTWRDLTIEIEALNEKRKTIEAALKLATPEVPFVDPTNGEKITECKKVFKTIVKTTINK
jgi:uncharacterized membrane protein